MKTIFTILLSIPLLLSAQVKETTSSGVAAPHYRSGDSALMAFIQRNINYPPLAVDSNIQGRVTLQLLIDTNGWVKEVKVLNSAHPLLNDEARRVAYLLHNFEPAREHGTAVKAYYTLPVNFKLADDDAGTLVILSDIDTSYPDAPPPPVNAGYYGTADTSVIAVASDRYYNPDDIDFSLVYAPDGRGIKAPRFAGGEAGLQKYFDNNIHYQPKSDKNKEDMINVRVVISNKGKISHVSAYCYHMDMMDEIERVIKKMPNWLPGSVNGKPLNIMFDFTLRYDGSTFRLDPIMEYMYEGK